MPLSERAVFIGLLDKLASGKDALSHRRFIELLRQANRHLKDLGVDLPTFLWQKSGIPADQTRDFLRGRGFRMDNDADPMAVTERKRLLKVLSDELYNHG